MPSEMGDICELCREINLFTVGAFFNNEKVVTDKNDHVDTSYKCSIIRTSSQLRADCPLCRVFLDQSDSNWSRELVRVEILADELHNEREPSHHIRDLFNASLSELGRFLHSKLGRVQYFPLSQLTIWSTFNGLDIRIPRYLDVFVDDDCTAETRKYVRGRVVHAADSDETLQKVAGWLGDCMKHHAFCHMGISGRRFDDNPQTTILPDRVIHVGSASVVPHLLETNGKRDRYVAMSYCWEPPAEPGKHPFRLIRGNKADLEQRLLLHELPLTLQHAIDFTRRLGMSYIWIDRLCIVQDDEDDWSTHANQMCSIYERALLTITALAASTRDEGLYLPRQERASVRVRCATRGRDLGGVMHIAPRLDPRAAFSSELSSSRWDTRGWTFQERLLSRRIVYFGRHQLFWECQERTYTQDDITDGSDWLLSGRDSPKHRLFADLRMETWVRTLSRVLPRLATRNPSCWKGIVKDYTDRQLTESTDKNEALAGVVEALKLRMHLPKYAHGIFLAHAAPGLLWFSKGSCLRRPDVVRAPSWGWIAYDGRVRILDVDMSTSIGTCSFVDGAAVWSIGAAPAPEVPDPAALRIGAARVVPMAWKAEAPSQTEQTDSWLGLAIERFAPVEEDDDSLLLPKFVHTAAYNKYLYNNNHNDGPPLFLCTKAGGLCGIVKFDLEDGRPPQAPTGAIWCLIIGEEWSPKSSGWFRKRKQEHEAKHRRIYHLLVLVLVSAGSDGKLPVYRRVGLAQAVWNGDFGVALHEEGAVGEVLLI